MNTRRILWGSGLLNVALLALLVWQLNRPPAAVAPGQPATPPETLSVVPDQAPAPARVALPPGTPFHWSQVASENLKVYRDNLLAIGCPRPTVRDIILGEINETFESRRRTLLASVQSRFWDFAARGELAIRSEWARPLTDLAAERQKLIDEVLGTGDGLTEAVAAEAQENSHQEYSWLPAAKRDALLALEQQRERQLEELMETIGRRADGAMTAEDYAQIEQLLNRIEAAKQELLTPEELEESRLRSAKESLWAAGLSGFEPTEEEWRKVTRLRTEFDEGLIGLAEPSLSDEDRRRRREELEGSMTDGIKDALGPERFRQFELASDADFQTVQKVTQRYGLADSVAFQACEVQRAAREQAQAVRDNPALDADAARQALTAIQQETERALTRMLGTRVFSTYREYGGSWLQELGQPAQ